MLQLHRDRTEIIIDILDFCREPRRISPIVRISNASPPDTRKRVNQLIQSNLLEPTAIPSRRKKQRWDIITYKTTEKGLKVIEAYHNMMEIWKK